MYVGVKNGIPRTTGMEAREKEFPWDYAAVSCVLLKDRSCPGIGLPPSDSDESSPATFLRDVSLSAYRDEDTSDMPLFFLRASVRGDTGDIYEFQFRFHRISLLEPPFCFRNASLGERRRCFRSNIEVPSAHVISVCEFTKITLLAIDIARTDRFREQVEEIDQGTILEGRSFLSHRRTKELRCAIPPRAVTVI